MTPWPVDQPIPRLCTVTDVCRILQISRRTFERLDRRRDLRLVEADRVGRGRRFTGLSVLALTQSQWRPRRVSA